MSATWDAALPASEQFAWVDDPEGETPRSSLCDRLMAYQDVFAPGTDLHRDLGMAAADIELMRREVAESRSKRSDLRPVDARSDREELL